MRNFGQAPYWHVINRGVDGQDIFGIDADRHVLEWLLARSVEEDGLVVHAYALMTNHFHLLLEFEGDDPSRVIQRIESAYARWFNDRTRRRGPLFEHRFIAIPVLPGTQYWCAARYIHANPLDIVGKARLQAYRWSSLPVYLGRVKDRHWLTTSTLERQIDPKRYLARVLQVDSTDLMSYGPLPPREPRTLDDLDAAIRVVLREPTLDSERLGSFSLVKALLARRLRLADVCVIAQHCDVAPSTLRRRAETARLLRAEDAAFDRLCDVVIEQLVKSESLR